jgi:hypothetical protein
MRRVFLRELFTGQRYIRAAGGADEAGGWKGVTRILSSESWIRKAVAGEWRGGAEGRRGVAEGRRVVAEGRRVAAGAGKVVAGARRVAAGAGRVVAGARELVAKARKNVAKSKGLVNWFVILSVVKDLITPVCFEITANRLAVIRPFASSG